MGWDEYIAAEGSPTLPKSTPQHQQATLQSLKAAAVAARELVAGAKTLIEWEDSGEPPVPADVALARAIICAGCPKNEKGGLETWFTKPASELIRRRVEKAQGRGLSTPRDDQLNICTACHCPLKLKVHIGLAWIEKRLTPEQKGRLDPRCWILSNS
jgi:hypothetical protein